MVFSDDKKTKFREAAGRALQLFAAYDDDFINSTKGFNRARVSKTYEVAANRWFDRSSQRKSPQNQTVDESSELSKNPVNFARRSVMLLEALRVRMGPEEISQRGSLKKLRQSYKSGTAPTLFPSKILLTFANFFYGSIFRTTYVDLV